MIMPVIAEITAAKQKQILESNLFAWIFLISLITIFYCLLNAVLFNSMSTVEDNMRQIISQFFINTAGNLSVYTMLLVGLQVSQKP